MQGSVRGDEVPARRAPDPAFVATQPVLEIVGGRLQSELGVQLSQRPPWGRIPLPSPRISLLRFIVGSFIVRTFIVRTFIVRTIVVRTIVVRTIEIKSKKEITKTDIN